MRAVKSLAQSHTADGPWPLCLTPCRTLSPRLYLEGSFVTIVELPSVPHAVETGRRQQEQSPVADSHFRQAVETTSTPPLSCLQVPSLPCAVGRRGTWPQPVVRAR